MAWTCPDCERRFGAEGRQHDCRPGLTLEQFYAGARPEARPIFERIHERLRTLEGDLIVDPLEKMILVKNGPTVCIVETMSKWVAVGFTLRRKLGSPRLSRKVQDYGGRYHHVVNCTDADQVDDELLDWIEEAFLRRDPPPEDGDDDVDLGAMVPDDVDDPFA